MVARETIITNSQPLHRSCQKHLLANGASIVQIGHCSRS